MFNSELSYIWVKGTIGKHDCLLWKIKIGFHFLLVSPNNIRWWCRFSQTRLVTNIEQEESIRFLIVELYAIESLRRRVVLASNSSVSRWWHRLIVNTLGKNQNFHLFAFRMNSITSQLFRAQIIFCFDKTSTNYTWNCISSPNGTETHDFPSIGEWEKPDDWFVVHICPKRLNSFQIVI